MNNNEWKVENVTISMQDDIEKSVITGKIDGRRARRRQKMKY